MLEMMSMGQKKKPSGPPKLKAIVTSGFDVGALAATRGVLATTSDRVYLMQTATGQVWSAALADLDNGQLNWKVVGAPIAAAGIMGTIYGRVDSPWDAYVTLFPAAYGGSANKNLIRWYYSETTTTTSRYTVNLTPAQSYTYGIGQAFIGSALYYFGGYTQATPPDMNVRRIQPGDTNFTVDSPGTLKPSPRGYMGFAAKGKKIYSIGGILVPPGDGTYPVSDELWEYDTDTHLWTKLANCPAPTRLSGVAEVIGDKLYTYGGYQDGNATMWLDTLWVYDIPTNTWATYPYSLVGTRSQSSGFQYKGKFYLVGGFKKGPSGNLYPNEIWEFAP